jgi:hypothetical protein
MNDICAIREAVAHEKKDRNDYYIQDEIVK